MVQVRTKEEKEAKKRLQEDQGYEINLTPSLSMFGLEKTLTFIIKVFLGWFKSILWLVLSLSYFGMKISNEKGETTHLWQIQRSTPRRRSARLDELSDPPRRSSASPRQTSPPRQTSSPRSSIASPRRTYKSCFVFSLPLILAIIHWINDDPNK